MKKLFLILPLLFPLAISANGLPKANIQITPQTIRMGQTVTADGSDSRNSAGNKYGLEMRCKFNFDENWTTYSSNLKINFTPKKEGNFIAQCSIRDKDNGGSVSLSRTYQVRSNLDRSARILVDTTETYVGDSLQFEISPAKDVSEDLDKIWVRWDFNSDGEWDTPFSFQKTKNHVYSLAGTYSPRAEVRFGSSGETTENLIVKGISPRGFFGRVIPTKYWGKIHVFPARVLPPSVQVSPGKMGNTESTMFTFDASDSKVPGSGWIEWSFDGEPFAKKYIGQKVVRKKFASPGKHEIRTRVCVDRSAPICEETLTTVEVKNNPTDFQLEINGQNMTNPTSFSNGNNQMNIFTGDKVRFSALRRQSASGSAKFEYRWRVDPISSTSKEKRPWGTGFTTQTFTEMSFNHTGVYIITAEARNEHGISANISRKIKVSPQPPIKIEIGVKPDVIFAGEWITFTPQIKIQNNGGPQVYASSFKSRFDADGDGVWDSVFRSGGSQRWRFDHPGTYEVKMQVVDAWKKVRTIRKSVTVQAYPKPVAHVKVSKKYGTLDTRFEFDAQTSEGRNLSFLWRIGNGKFQKRGARFFQKFSTVGNKWIALRVVDKNLIYDEIRFLVIVKKADPVPKTTTINNTTTSPKHSLMKVYPENSLLMLTSLFAKKSPPTYSGDNVWALPSRSH